MSLIQCAKKCKHQKEGYCTFDRIGVVTNAQGGCAHFVNSSTDDLDSLTDCPDPDNGDGTLG